MELDVGRNARLVSGYNTWPNVMRTCNHAVMGAYHYQLKDDLDKILLLTLNSYTWAGRMKDLRLDRIRGVMPASPFTPAGGAP